MGQIVTENWMQDAKDMARAERELKIEEWVYITIEVRNEDRSREVLHIFDIPRDMLERWRWVINWRKAKLVCKYPRKHIDQYYCYYDKRTGLQTGMNSLLMKVSSAKAQITKVERIIKRYIDEQQVNNMFFNPETDEILQKAYLKLEKKRENYQTIYTMLEEEVKKHRENNDIYKLFIGFKKLGEFTSIMEAKKFADQSGHWGTFNLLGDKYHDAWYISQPEVKTA